MGLRTERRMRSMWRGKEMEYAMDNEKSEEKQRKHSGDVLRVRVDKTVR